MPNYRDHSIKCQIDGGTPIREAVSACKGSDLLEVFCRHPETFASIALHATDVLESKIRSMEVDRKNPWEGLFPERSSYSSSGWNFKSGVKSLTPDWLRVVRAELGFQLATGYYARDDYAEVGIVEKLLGDAATPEKSALLDKFTRLWVALRRVSGHKGWDDQSRAARVAVESYIMQLVEDSPVLWAESLHLILAKAGEIGELADIITITLASRSQEVEDALRFIGDHSESQELREHARGLLLLAQSMDQPKPAVVNQMIDMLSRWAGRGVLFPHPLSPSSKTWLASHDGEAEIQLGLRSGLRQFEEHFRLQGAEDERALVGRLLTELAVPFRAQSPVTSALGRLGLGTKPRIRIEHRPFTPTEEKAHGPDVAFITRASLHGSMKIEFAEFVQVKKPNRHRGRWKESWKIDIEQLNNLLTTSATSVYWLIDWEGRVCAVPAKYIKAWMPTKAGATFTLGFNSIRSAAIPAEQFLSELFLGAWVGNHHPTTMKIARGEVPGLVPRNLVEVSVVLHGDENR